MIEVAFFLPLLSFLIIHLIKASKNISLYVSISIMLLSAICFNTAFIQFLMSNEKSVSILLWRWIDMSSSLKANIALHLDALSGIMGIVVINISTLVHIYSIGYMSQDLHQEKFMSYLSLFTFFMLMLIFSDNLLQLFIGWEGVGLCSYLLIGFWNSKKSANKAAVKAFVVNRVGDVGLILAMGLMLMTFYSVEFSNILNTERIQSVIQQKFLDITMIDLICICLFIGCMGKSAQILLHIWLPDAMEGPTPVSALIHAATMVTAGVFLIVRCSILFEHSQLTLNIITVIGAVTALFAATIGIVQTDIKKIIAYSTCSQLGYMFFACGLSAYSAAIFHLFTHAFFKALLFLSAGSVIHGIHGEQNIHAMGGLRKYMPVTYILMLIGSLAITGIFPFAGFFSKDAILESAYANHTWFGNFAYYIGLTAAFLTAFYSWRLLICVFHVQKEYSTLPHESGKSMLLPLIVLGIGAVLSGILGKGMLLPDFWRGSIVIVSEEAQANIFIEFLPMLIGVIGIISAYIIYKFKFFIKCEKLRSLIMNGYYFDCIYFWLFIKPIECVSKFLFKFFDVKFIEYIFNLMPNLIKAFGDVLKYLHRGNVQTYVIMMFAFISLSLYQLLSDLQLYEFWLVAIGAIVLYLGIISKKINEN